MFEVASIQEVEGLGKKIYKVTIRKEHVSAQFKVSTSEFNDNIKKLLTDLVEQVIDAVNGIDDVQPIN